MSYLGEILGEKFRRYRARYSSALASVVVILRVVPLSLRWRCLAVIAASVALALFPAVLAYQSKVIIDAIFPMGPTHTLISNGPTGSVPVVLCSIYCAALLFYHLAYPLTTSITDSVIEAVSAAVHLAVMQSGLRLQGLRHFDDPGFYDRRSIIERNAFATPVTLLRPASDLCAAAATICAMAVLLWSLHPAIPILVLMAGAPDVLAQIRAHRLTYEGIAETAPEERLREYYKSIMTTRDFANEVRLYGLDGFIHSRYDSTIARLNAILSPIRAVQTVTMSATRAAISVGTTLPYLWIVTQALANSASFGQLAMFMSACLVIQQHLSRISQTIAGHHDVFVATNALASWLQLPSDISDGASAQSPRHSHSASPLVVASNVWFRYPGAKSFTLKGLNLELMPGRSLALVGANGCGKTTIVKLLCRLYDPDEGEISIDGIDIRSLNVRAFRKSMAPVFQDFVHYELTVAENIALMDTDSSGVSEAVRNAANISQAKDFIDRLPDNYNTVLGREFEGGIDLSTGQWQRIALARAFFRKTGVLILDEPTSSVDVDTEAKLYAQFKEMTSGKTSLLIAHRLSTVRAADAIAVMHDGKIVELGDHRSLMSVDGFYREMFLTQARRYQAQEEEGVQRRPAS